MRKFVKPRENVKATTSTQQLEERVKALEEALAKLTKNGGGKVNG